VTQPELIRIHSAGTQKNYTWLMRPVVEYDEIKRVYVFNEEVSYVKPEGGMFIALFPGICINRK